jgi:glycine/D-amino acid oxidase-like deaminating enzyme
MSSPDVIVIGAGIVGAACAMACAREGLRVEIIEAQMIGGGATSAGMGHLVVMDDSEAQFALTKYSVELWRELAPRLPADAEFFPCGTIWVAADQKELEMVRQKHGFYTSRGVAAEILDARAIAEAEPHLRPGLAGGLLVPNDAVIYPPCAARLMIEDAIHRGASIQIGKRVTSIQNGAVSLQDSSKLSTSAVINAAGTFAPELTPGLDIKPRKGHLVITDRYDRMVRHQLVELGYLTSAHGSTNESTAFNVQPRPTGQLLIGSSRQYGATNGAIEQKMLRSMLERARAFIPDAGEISAVRSWTGFRAATPDKLPYIGRSARDERLFIAAGHEGLGITTSLGTAELIVAELLGHSPKISPLPYRADRKFDRASKN